MKNLREIINEEQIDEAVTKNIREVLDRRAAKCPSIYDNGNIKEYHEWFIKGTNVMLGYEFIDSETNEHGWVKRVGEGTFDLEESYDDENDFLKELENILMNKHLVWGYEDNK